MFACHHLFTSWYKHSQKLWYRFFFIFFALFKFYLVWKNAYKVDILDLKSLPYMLPLFYFIQSEHQTASQMNLTSNKQISQHWWFHLFSDIYFFEPGSATFGASNRYATSHPIYFIKWLVNRSNVISIYYFNDLFFIILKFYGGIRHILLLIYSLIILLQI